MTGRTEPRGLRWGAVSWIGILLAIGVVQLVRAQWFDAGVFFAVSTVLVADSLRGGTATGERPASTRSASTRWVPAAAIAVGAIACALPRHSPPMQALVCAAGIAAVLYAWPQRGPSARPWPDGARRLARAWAIIVVAGCLWELSQFVVGLRSPQRPAYALSDLLDPVLSTWLGRFAFIALWLAGGVFLLLRGRR